MQIYVCICMPQSPRWRPKVFYVIKKTTARIWLVQRTFWRIGRPRMISTCLGTCTRLPMPTCLGSVHLSGSTHVMLLCNALSHLMWQGYQLLASLAAPGEACMRHACYIYMD